MVWTFHCFSGGSLPVGVLLSIREGKGEKPFGINLYSAGHSQQQRTQQQQQQQFHCMNVFPNEDFV